MIEKINNELLDLIERAVVEKDESFNATRAFDLSPKMIDMRNAGDVTNNVSGGQNKNL